MRRRPTLWARPRGLAACVVVGSGTAMRLSRVPSTVTTSTRTTGTMALVSVLPVPEGGKQGSLCRGVTLDSVR